MNLIWQFQTARMVVECGYTPEEDPDLSWADDETNAQLESGGLVNVTFWVKVRVGRMVVGTSSLGNSVYADPRDFAREHFGLRPLSRRDGVTYGSYFPDMVREAIHEARRTLKDMPNVRAAA